MSEHDALTYEQIVERLEAITDQLGRGEIGIEEAATLYEEAGRLHAEASARLARVETRIAELRATSDPAADPGADAPG